MTGAPPEGDRRALTIDSGACSGEHAHDFGGEESTAKVRMPRMLVRWGT
ncbi:hypothetical protein [Actinokineospora diospyrosa]|nr:hypothetical protein [Actinokineospora diospyrosa]